jgi:hypothetical protein
MQAILQWLWQNKEWVFSGIGVLILSVGVGAVYKWHVASTEKRTKKSHALSPADLYDKVVAQLTQRPLSQTLIDVIILAQSLHDSELERWARLESGGYLAENRAIRETDEVPTYRTVVGQYHDSYGRPLIISDPSLDFIMEERLRNPTAELESLACVKDLLHMSDARALNLIKGHLGVTVEKFVFSPSSIMGVLAGIQQELLDRLRKIRVTPK